MVATAEHVYRITGIFREVMFYTQVTEFHVLNFHSKNKPVYKLNQYTRRCSYVILSFRSVVEQTFLSWKIPAIRCVH